MIGKVEIVGTIDITPTWRGIIDFHIGVLDGTIKIEKAYREQAKQDARVEIHRLAAFADGVNVRVNVERGQLQRLVDIIWHDGPDTEWTANEIEWVANELIAMGYGPCAK